MSTLALRLVVALAALAVPWWPPHKSQNCPTSGWPRPAGRTSSGRILTAPGFTTSKWGRARWRNAFEGA